MTARAEILPPSQWAGFSAEEAAAFVGVSASHFRRMVQIGEMPAPKRLGKREIWPRTALIRALDPAAAGAVNPWDELET